jgi:hypothetical protein
MVEATIVRSIEREKSASFVMTDMLLHHTHSAALNTLEHAVFSTGSHFRHPVTPW